MQFNIQKFKAVAENAKSKTNDKRWQNAIDKAVAGVVSGWWVITELSDGVMVTTETGKTYHANGSCQCRAYELGQPCKHRALARLVELYNEETTTPVVSLADERAQVIADIQRAWPIACPGVHLADELMARFKRNSLEMLSIDFLTAIRAAIA